MSGFPTVGILGGGQLGRMSAMAALRMGLDVRTLSPSFSGPVASLGHAHTGDWEDEQVMKAFLGHVDVVTVESEWAPADVAARVSAGGTPVWPSPSTLETIRHKGRQKRALEASGVAVAPWRSCPTIADARQAVKDFGFPVIAKRFEGSYDGYGNATIRTVEDVETAWSELAAEDGLLIEDFIDFKRELAVMVARRPSGQTVVYPVVVTEQKDHRCHAVWVPSGLTPDRIAAVEAMALQAAEAVDAVGVLGVELFEGMDGTLLLNELAPRPHNTGHYTIEACHTSQFENHIRAVLDWPLGDPSLRVPAAVMINVLGHRAGALHTDGYTNALGIDGASVHLYGKRDVRPKRKMGHVTVTAHTVEEAREKAESAAALIQL
ncbi:MAG: 5-(carboxyamino)imidazole ribonucleotide synthase [Rhodothermales bacterium]